MQQAIDKARILVEAMGWVRRFRDRFIIVKLGGSALDDEQAVRGVLTDVVFMATVGMKPILIHGGGKAISRAMADAGIAPTFVEGRRFTDAATLAIVSRVLGRLSDSLVEGIREIGAEARKLHCDETPVLFGEKLSLKGGATDLGHVGSVTGVDQDLLATITAQRTIPVIPCLAVSAGGEKLNVNGDTAAAAIARLLNVEKLVFMSDVPGLMRDPENADSLISHIAASDCRELIADGTIRTGMVPKVEAAIEAVEAGVRKVHFVAADVPHSLLLEVYSDTGIGTEIVADDPKD